MTFSPEGWASIKNLHNRLTSTITFWWDSETLVEQTYDEASQRGLFAAWDCLESMEAAAILAPNGAVIQIEPSTLASAGWIEQKSNFAMNLDYGTLGSGHGDIFYEGGDIDKPMKRSLAIRHYGPFAFCPILVPKVTFDSFMNSFSNLMQKESGYGEGPQKPSSVVDEIFAMVDSGRARRRDDIKRLLAKDMKVDEWRAHWRQAVVIRPSLGRSGPKKRPQNS